MTAVDVVGFSAKFWSFRTVINLHIKYDTAGLLGLKPVEH